MIYALKDLLMKMGAPEVAEKTTAEWFYFDDAGRDLAGLAAIRLEAGGEKLTAELKHIKAEHETDNGEIVHDYTDHFHLAAERTARAGHYRITTVTFDGQTYDKPSKAVIELALSVFHAKALDISLRMIQQSFARDEMLQKHEDTSSLFRRFMGGREHPLKAAKNRRIDPKSFGSRPFGDAARRKTDTLPATGAVVIPFRPRKSVAKAV